MATKIMKMTKATQTRAKRTATKSGSRRETLDVANEKFKGDRITGELISPSRDIANVRERRNNSDDGIVDLSSLQWMQSCNRRKLEREIAMAHQERYHWRTNAEDREELSNRLREAERHQGFPRELAQYRNFEITSDLLAVPFALGAFQSINLSADELPQIITPKARQYFQVRYIGQDGGSHQDQWRTTRSALEIEMNLISTDRVEYPLMDLQQGDVNAFSTINEQLRFDMEMKIDNFALQNIISNKVVSGLKGLLNIHPDIDQANLPDTNYLDLTDVPTFGTANVWTIQRLKALLNHISMWGFGFDPDGAISMQTMIMSPLNARDSWDYVDLVSGFDSSGKAWGGRSVDDPKLTISTEQRNQIASTGGMMQSGWGHSWQTQYNARVTKGRAYVFTNQPIGWFFTKSEWDRTIEWKDEPDWVDQNIAAVVHRKALRFYMPALWAYRMVMIDF